MKTIFVLTIIVVLQLEQVSALSINDPECDIYLRKFTWPNFSETISFNRAAMSGDVSFVTRTANAKVSLRYSDADFFNDPKYFGLVKEDGKTDDSVCLDLKLLKYTSKCYEDPVQVTDLTITPSNNSEKQWRYYSFIIPENEFTTRLIKKSNSDQFIYTGYYALAFYAAGTDQLQYDFLFEFSLSIDKATGAALDTSFKSLSDFPIQFKKVKDECKPFEDTQLKWCTDLACTAYATPDLHLNDTFVLKQIIEYSSRNRLYLTGTQVWYTGDGLLKRASPIFIYNAIPGEVIIQLKAEIVWNKVTIVVTSTMSTFQSSQARKFGQTEFVLTSVESDQIDCIKAEGSETCATCEQQFDVNGFAHDGCQRSLVSQSLFFQWIAFIFLVFVLIFTIRFLHQSYNKSHIFNYQQLVQP